jgi:hypothetical protein
MPRTIGKVTYEAQMWKLLEFEDRITGSRSKPVHQVRQSVGINWETSRQERKVIAALVVDYHDKSNPSVALLHAVLIAQFDVSGFGSNALHSDTIGLPEAVWLAMAREVYDTLRGIVMARVKLLEQCPLPTVPEAAFSIGKANDLGLVIK